MKKLANVIAIVVLVTAFGFSGTAHAALVGHWPFDVDGDDPTLDVSGNGNDGTLGDAVSPDTTNDPAYVCPSTAPVPGNVCNLDFATGEFVRVSNSPDLRPTHITVSAWVRNDGTPTTFDYILTKNLTGGFGSYAFYTGGGAGLFFYVSGATFHLSPFAPPAIWDGEWHHIAGTYDGVDVRLYVDGIEVGGGTPYAGGITYGVAVLGGDLTIGSWATFTEFFDWKGDIDDVRIYNAALNADEIALLASPPLPVDIDIKPGSDPNSINLCSRGVLPIAILGSETFNVRDIDTTSLEFEGAGVAERGKKIVTLLIGFEDVNGDSFDDLVVKFDIEELDLLDGDSTGTVTGELMDGTPFAGTDDVRIVKSCE